MIYIYIFDLIFIKRTNVNIQIFTTEEFHVYIINVITYIINDYFHKLRSMTLPLKLMTCIKHTCMRACMLDMKVDTKKR